MKILALHVDSFGKLKNFDLNFDRDITEIFGENGYGKTTLATFIKAMFYGLPDNRAKDKSRKLYAPWSGGDFGGSMDIETEHGRYRVTRRFSLTGGDSFELLSLETLLPSEDYTEKIGEELFCVGAESYEKSVYLPQRRVDVKMTDQIGARLTGLLESSNDMADFSEAIERIKARRREFELYRGSRGLIDSARDELSECERRIAQCTEQLKLASDLRAKADALEAEGLQTESDIKLLSGRLREENEKKIIRKDHERYRDLCKEADELAGELDSLKAEFADGVPTQEELNRADHLEREIVFARRHRADLVMEEENTKKSDVFRELFEERPLNSYELSSYVLDARSVKEMQAEIRDLEAEMPEKLEEKQIAQRKNLTVSCATFALGLVLLIAGTFINTVLMLLGAAVFFAGGIFCVVTVTGMGRVRSEAEKAEQKSKEILRKKEQLASLEQKLGDFLAAYGMSCTNGDPQELLKNLAEAYELHSKAESKKKDRARELAETDADIEKKESELYRFLERYGFVGEREKTSSEIRRLAEDLKRVFDEHTKKKEKAESLKAEKNLSDEPLGEEIDTKQLEDAISAAQKRLNQLNAERSRFVERAQRFEDDSEELAQLKDRAATLSDNIVVYERKKNVYDKTEKLLTEARANLSSRYIVDMKNSFAKRFNALTGNDKDIDLDAKLDIKLRDEGGAKKSDLYSTGWQEAIAICLRLALIDSLYGEERPCLILDDPFVNLDEEKLKGAKEMLRAISADMQIIYLTCHESRSVK